MTEPSAPHENITSSPKTSGSAEPSPPTAKKPAGIKRKLAASTFYTTTAADYPNKIAGGFFKEPRARSDRQTIPLTLLSPLSWMSILTIETERPTAKAIMERIQKLKVIQLQFLQQMGIELPQNMVTRVQTNQYEAASTVFELDEAETEEPTGEEVLMESEDDEVEIVQKGKALLEAVEPAEQEEELNDEQPSAKKRRNAFISQPFE
nr:hypothetical protein CFP56_33621 [Quercus suber]